VRLGLPRASRAYPFIAAAAAAALVGFVVAGALPRWRCSASPGSRCSRARRRRAAHFDAPMELVPANAYTVVGHLASAVALAVGLVWAGLGGGANAAVLAVAAAGLLVVLYYNRSIGRLSRAFYGVKEAVARS
jgi:hypothetical protein